MQSRSGVNMSENKSVLKFSLLVEASTLPVLARGSLFFLMNKVNSVPWLGKETRSCRILDFRQREAVPVDSEGKMCHAEFAVAVCYRPPGWISGVASDGSDRLNGWEKEVRDQTKEGVLLDGYGKPLPHGVEPVYLRFEILHEADFNEYDFGSLLAEGPDDPIEGKDANSVGQGGRVQVNEFKTDCQLEKGGHTIDVFAHFVEVRYSERIVFWNVVLQVTDDEIGKLGEIGSAPVGLRLPYGRTGFMYLTHVSVSGQGITHHEFAGVGKPNG